MAVRRQLPFCLSLESPLPARASGIEPATEIADRYSSTRIGCLETLLLSILFCSTLCSFLSSSHYRSGLRVSIPASNTQR